MQIQVVFTSQKHVGVVVNLGVLIFDIQHVGDIILAIAEHLVTGPDELFATLVGEAVGTPTTVEILRGGVPQKITITIGERK